MQSKKSDFSEFKEKGIVAAIILFFITIVVTALLAYVNSVTAPTITMHNIEVAKEARMAVFPIADDFKDISLDFIDNESIDIVSIYTALDSNDNVIGLVIESLGHGYGGDIKVMTGIDSTGTVVGLEVLSHNETPGLGTKAALPSFTGLFLNKEAGVKFTVNKDDPLLNHIDAITGVTISSRAITNAANVSVDFAAEVFKTLINGGDVNG